MCIKINYKICETDNFYVVTTCKPHIDRMDGGHIIIISRIKKYKTITDLPVALATELIMLMMVIGEAMKEALNRNGITIKLINYQFNGNWSANKVERDPLHVHLYGRSEFAIHQRFGEALYLPMPDTGFYDNYSGLSYLDIEAIKKGINDIINEGKYQVNINFN